MKIELTEKEVKATLEILALGYLTLRGTDIKEIVTSEEV